MLSYGKAFYDLKNGIQVLYDEGEASAIAHEMLSYITGLDKLRRLDQKDVLFTPKQQIQFDIIKDKLLLATPPQYIIGTGWFMNREFNVNENVLIPRPETEELVQWILDDNAKNKPGAAILDIGTGSGCIAVSVKLGMPDSEVMACDVSTGALLVARSNADKFNAAVQFQHVDFLNECHREPLGKFDIIASNPPYIPFTEKDNLHKNVTDHEPHVALFVPGDEPLLFYYLIADFGKTHLNDGGIIYCELDRDYAEQTRDMFLSKGYTNVEIRKDLSGNTRMIKVSL